MGKITVVIDDELERKVRIKIAKDNGKKGALSEAAAEGLKLWLIN